VLAQRKNAANFIEDAMAFSFGGFGTAAPSPALTGLYLQRRGAGAQMLPRTSFALGKAD
jgi:hypothetical protein